MTTKQRVSERSFIGGDSIEESTGAKYTLVKATGKDAKGADVLSPVKSFEFTPATTDAFTRMCAEFGFHTKVGNVANTVINDKTNPGTIEMAAQEIEEWIAAAQGGLWAERGGGVGGPRYDREKLAAAIASAKGEADPAPYLAKMDTKVKVGSREISYGAFALRNKAVKDAYDALVGVQGTDITEL